MKKILLVGNSNTGKTTFFNNFTKSNEIVGNWHGVTNDFVSKTINLSGEECEVIDLPGIYSLSPLNSEEKISTDAIFENKNNLILNICDQNNIQRNLYLTLELLELGAKVVLIINKIGKKVYNHIDVEGLSKELGIPVFFANLASKKECELLKQKILNFKKEDFKKVNFEYIQKFLKEYPTLKIKNTINFPKEFLLLKILEGEEEFLEKFYLGNKQSFVEQIERVAKERFLFISSLKSIKHEENKIYGTSPLDKIFLNKIFAMPLYFLSLFTALYATFFSVGNYISEQFEFFIQEVVGGFLFDLLKGVNAEWLLDSIENALLVGIGSVLAFLPQIMLLFAFLYVLQESGYLSRLAFLFEDIFSIFGLSGKSIYTLMMGFGCSATAIMTAGNLEDENTKIKTALVTPFMSCSAKLPIYAIFAGVFFGSKNVLVIFLLYVFGAILGILTSAIFEKTFLKSKEKMFIMEFANMQPINVSKLLENVFSSLKSFLTKVANVLIFVNIIVWFLSSFTFDLKFINNSSVGKSILQVFAEFLSPIFVPLGFGNWPFVAAILTGIVAKEVVVSTLSIFNNAYSTKSLKENLIDPNTIFFLSPSAGLSFMVFCLLYTPCVVALSNMKEQIGAKLTAISAICHFVFAYIFAFVVYRLHKISLLVGPLKVFGFFALLALVVFLGYKAFFKHKCSTCSNCSLKGVCTKKVKKLHK